MSVVSTLDNNKTKIVGMITIVLGFIQAYPGLPDLLSKTGYAWAMFIIGILVTAFGFWNTYQTNQANKPIIPPSSPALIGVFVVLLLVLLVSGCTTPPLAPTREACARDEAYSAIRCASGVAQEYEVYQESILRLVEDPGTPDEVKQRLRQVDAALTPVMVTGIQITRDYRAIRFALDAGETQEDQLRIANANIETWLVSALPKLAAMREALGL